MVFLKLESTAITIYLLEMDVLPHALLNLTMIALEALLITHRYARKSVETEDMMDITHVMMEICTQEMDVVISVQLSKDLFALMLV